MRQLAEKESNKITFDKEGQIIEGYYLGRQEKQGRPDENGNVKPYYQYTLKEKSGKEIIFNGSSDIDAWFAKIEEGHYVWITYLTKIGNFKKFKVEIDPELPVIQVDEHSEEEKSLDEIPF